MSWIRSQDHENPAFCYTPILTVWQDIYQDLVWVCNCGRRWVPVESSEGYTMFHTEENQW